MKRFKVIAAGCVLMLLAIGIIWGLVLRHGVPADPARANKTPASDPTVATQQADTPNDGSTHPQDLSDVNSPPSFSPKQDEAVFKEYGVTTGQPIETGFVFLDGKYLDAPYTVSRKGGSVYINEHWVYRTAGDDKPPLMAHPEKVKLPEGIDKNTSLYDKRMGEYFRNMIAAVQATHTREEEIKIMEAVYRKLPFIKDAKVDEKEPDLLHVTTYRGETSTIGLATPRRKPRTDNKSRYEEAKIWRKSFDRGLQEGVCYFLFTRGGHVTCGNPREALPVILRILQSDNPVEKKLKDLKEAGYPWFASGTFLKQVTNFSTSPQLKQRLSDAPHANPKMTGEKQ